MLLELMRLLERTLRFGEVIAGTASEEALVGWLARELEELGWEVCLRKIEVDSWRDFEGFLEVGGKLVEGVVTPTTLSGEVKGRLIAVSEPLSESWPSLDGGIALCELPRDPDELKTVYLRCVEAGGGGLVVYDFAPKRVRRIMVAGVWDYRWKPAPPPPIPCLFISREEGMKLVKEDGSWGRLRCRSEVVRSYGYTVEATREGVEDGFVVVSCHHDHWLTGASDDLVGVAMLLKLAEKVEGGKARYGLRLVSFTAEESGALDFQPWYWIHGSRGYVKELEREGELDSVVAVVNVDSCTRKPVHLAESPEIRSLLERTFSSRGLSYVLELDTSYCDSYSFTLAGVPAITLHSLPAILDIYHSSADVVEAIDWKLVKEEFLAVVKVLERLLEKGWKGLDYEAYWESVSRLLMTAANFAGIKPKLEKPEKPREFFSSLTKNCVRAIFKGDYRRETG